MSCGARFSCPSIGFVVLLLLIIFLTWHLILTFFSHSAAMVVLMLYGSVRNLPCMRIGENKRYVGGCVFSFYKAVGSLRPWTEFRR